jgi:hypothetical protein
MAICVERFGRGQTVVELFHGCEKAIDFLAPWQGRRIMPRLFSLRDRERPIEEIAQVREDLRGRARFVADMKARKMVGSAAQRFAGAVGNGSNGVAEKLAGRIGRLVHIKTPVTSLPGTSEL